MALNHPRGVRHRKSAPVPSAARAGSQRPSPTVDGERSPARLPKPDDVFQPGEVIEFQRGAVKSRFQVLWIGAKGSAAEGQAGVRLLDQKTIMPADNLPADQPVPVGVPPAQDEKRSDARISCNGGALVAGVGNHLVWGPVKDVSRAGVYIETGTPMPVNTEVVLKMDVQGMTIESAGIVRTSYPFAGMGIALRRTTADNQKKLATVLRNLKELHSAAKYGLEIRGPLGMSVVFEAEEPLPKMEGTAADSLAKELSAAQVAKACVRLADAISEGQDAVSGADMEELRKAADRLRSRLYTLSSHPPLKAHSNGASS